MASLISEGPDGGQRRDVPRAGRPAAAGRGRRFLTTAAILLPLVGVMLALILVFQPFASAAGGCGGG
ncbi:MAG TPA: hypothetical protein VLX31_07080 [Streptosporangiaceae bacterium]|nr:hypothetical protein [Streptosporangiaceae bacterium]